MAGMLPRYSICREWSVNGKEQRSWANQVTHSASLDAQFEGASFNSPLNGWNTLRVTDMTAMVRSSRMCV